MKLFDVLLEYKMPKKPKARPKKTLWFDVPQLWKHDLDLAHPNHKLYYNEEEETFYALDNDQQKCYGSWNGKKKVGVTFYQPRPRLAVISPRARISEYVLGESMKLHEMASLKPSKRVMLNILRDDFYRGDWDDFESWAESVYNTGFPALDSFYKSVGPDTFDDWLDQCIEKLRVELSN